MVDELSSRRSSIQAGNLISLANDQEWTFPAPTADSEFAVEAAGTEYLGLIRAIMEAADQSDRRLAELAMAIFLRGTEQEFSSSYEHMEGDTTARPIGRTEPVSIVWREPPRMFSLSRSSKFANKSSLSMSPSPRAH